MPEENNPAGGKGKIPMPLLLIGGGVVVLVLLLKGGGSSSTSGGIDTAALSDQIAELKAGNAADLAAARADFDDRLRLAESDAATASQAAAVANAAKDEQKGLLAQILAAITGLAKPADAPPAAPPAPAPPAAPPSLGPKPSDSAIKDWAHAIGLPEAWGFGFVGRYGILPRDIPELEKWRSEIGIFNGHQWCIAGECIG